MNQDKSVFISKKEIDSTLTQEPVAGTRQLEPLKSLAIAQNLPFNILEDTNVANTPEVHLEMGDLWYALEGEVTFMYGGELVNSISPTRKDGTINKKELKGSSIEGGTEVTLHPGDWLWIPPGEPHQHLTKGTVRLVTIDLLHGNKSTAISEFRPKSPQNFLAYPPDKPQNLFSDFVSKF
ncbi:MAG: hypothetical protein G01um101433_752 [Parcubacteria group bacterium Gr01-1014_33]|nr:MAG: hypothetical protein G01um101433_752 [Parcubacteria group bacterium Gr01-1014_33]